MSTLTLPREVQPWRRRLYLPAYEMSVAARYAKTSPITVYYWHYKGGMLGPALPGKEPRRPLSYLQLVEVAFVATFRALGVSLQRIRRAREYAAQIFKSEYPFSEKRWLTEGHHVMLDLREIEKDGELGKLVIADEAGQMAWQQLIGEKFAEFDYEHDLALVWHVAGRQKPIIIDPRIAFGAPTVRGVPTWVLKGRWEAGEQLDEIKEDFGIPETELLIYALEFEGIQVSK